MHWDNFCSSTRVSSAGVEEDDEHCHNDEEAQGPQEVVQEDVHLGAPTVIRSLPGGKISSREGFNHVDHLLGWIVVHRDPGSAVIKFCCGVRPKIKFFLDPNTVFQSQMRHLLSVLENLFVLSTFMETHPGVLSVGDTVLLAFASTSPRKSMRESMISLPFGTRTGKN